MVVIISLSVVGDLFIVVVFLDADEPPPRGTGKLYSQVRPSVSPRLYLMNRLFEKSNLLPVLAVVATSIKFKSAFLHAE